VGQAVKDHSRVCPLPPGPIKRGNWLLNSKNIIMAVGLVSILTTASFSALVSTTPTFAPPIVITGEPSDHDALLLRFDDNGDLLWNMTFRSSVHDYVSSVVEVSSGGFLMSGKTELGGHPMKFELWLIRTDADGNLLWNKTLGEVNSGGILLETSDGGFAILYGNFTSSTNYHKILRIDRNGQPVQQFEMCYYADTFWEHGEGGFVVAGRDQHEPYGTNIAMIDKDGNELWTQHLEFPWSPPGQDFIIEATTGGFMLVGYAGPDVGSYLISTDTEGNKISAKNYPEGNFKSILQCSDNGFLLVGPESALRFDVAGKALWKYDFNYLDGEYHNLETFPFEFVELQNGGFVFTHGACEVGEMFVLECITEQGRSVWNHTFDLVSEPRYHETGPIDIAACSDGGFVLTGSVESSYLTPLIDSIPRAEQIIYRIYPEILVAGAAAFLSFAVIVVFGKQNHSTGK